tara:strand:+ start:11097 stop:11393 length:297 start_codon:yes stop_codon:yes gene_type:complete
MKTIYDYLNWRVEIKDDLVTVNCTLEREPDENEFSREYTLKGFHEILIQLEYIYFLDSDESTMYCLKLEGESCIVIDDWRDDEFPLPMGCHDFYDEVE